MAIRVLPHADFRLINIKTGFSPEKVSTQAALIFDGMLLLAEAFKRMGMEQLQPINLDCMNPESSWNKGYTVSGFMKTVNIDHHYFVHLLFASNWI